MMDKKKDMAQQKEPKGDVRDLTGWRDLVTVLAPTQGSSAIFPGGYPLHSATFTRKGVHLMVSADHFPEVMVPKFFGGAHQTTLVTEDGVEISRHMILLMTNLSTRVALALNALAGGGD